MRLEDITMEVDTNIRLSDVILSDINRDKINKVIAEQRATEVFKKFGLTPTNKIIMYGASGTGKTYLTKALSNTLGYRMVYVDISSLYGEEVVHNIREVFRVTNEVGRCVVFFDECDSIAWSRDSVAVGSSQLRLSMNTLFQCMDQMNSSNLFVAATNMFHRIDNAFARRFDIKMEFEPPKERIENVMYKFIPKDIMVENDISKVYCDIINNQCIGESDFSYYLLKKAVERTVKAVILKGERTIKVSKLFEEIEESMGIKVKDDVVKARA